MKNPPEFTDPAQPHRGTGAREAARWRQVTRRAIDTPRAALLALAIGATLCAGATLLAWDVSRKESQIAFEAKVSRLSQRIETELADYESVINLSRLFVDPSAGNPIDGLKGYLLDSVLGRYYPATRYLAFVRRVPGERMAAYEQSVRSRLAFDENGVPSIQPRPAPGRSEHFFVETSVPAEIIRGHEGADVSADEALMKAAAAALDRGESFLLLGSAHGPLVRPLLVAPVLDPVALHRADRLTGYLIHGIDVAAVVRRALGEEMPRDLVVRLRLSEAGSHGASEDLFSGGVGADAPEDGIFASVGAAQFVAVRPVRFGGARLTFEVRGAAGASSLTLPAMVLVMGLLVCAVLVLLVRQIQRSWRAAEALAERRGRDARVSEERFRNMVESSSDWIWETDREGNLRYASPNTQALLGYTPGELFGRPLASLADPSGDSQVFPSGAPASYTAFERTLRRRDGGEVRFESAATPVFDESGGFAGMRGIDRDVTAQRRYRERLANLQQELADNMQANLMAQLVSGIAHELTQPLAAIASYNQACIRLLQSGRAEPGEIAAAMRATADNALLAGNVIKRVRRFTERRAPQAVATDIAPLVHNALGLIEHRLRASGVTVTVDCAPTLPAVLADPILLTQVLLNLFHNAIDAMAASATRRLEIRARALASSVVHLAVRDTGSGIGAADAARVFEPYYSTKPQGMGLGLTISRSILEALDGTLAFEPASGGGTIFSIELPAETKQREPSVDPAHR